MDHPQLSLRLKNALACVFLLAVMLVRVVYVPFHLATHEHAEGHAHAVALDPGHHHHGHEHHGHDHGADHSHHGSEHGVPHDCPEHPPHSEAEHESELLSSRTVAAKFVLQPVVLPQAERSTEGGIWCVQTFTAEEHPPPDEGPLREGTSRGPPIHSV